jgi:hypothetical protein
MMMMVRQQRRRWLPRQYGGYRTETKVLKPPLVAPVTHSLPQVYIPEQRTIVKTQQSALTVSSGDEVEHTLSTVAFR